MQMQKLGYKPPFLAWFTSEEHDYDLIGKDGTKFNQNLAVGGEKTVETLANEVR
jgi:hypothetical protein